MKIVLLLLLGSIPAFSQFFLFGVKGGVPLTDFVDAASSGQIRFHTTTHRYIVGPTVEIGLPLGFRFEADALYRRLNYTGNSILVDVFRSSRTTGNAWEFPLLLKWRMPTPVIKPFVDGGVAFDTLSGLKQTVVNTIVGQEQTTTSTSNPAELRNSSSVGVVLGAGLDIHAIFIHISPEVRYTRWNNAHFRDASGLLNSNQNQAEFLVGFTF